MCTCLCSHRKSRANRNQIFFSGWKVGPIRSIPSRLTWSLVNLLISPTIRKWKTKIKNNASAEPGLSTQHQRMGLMSVFPGHGRLFELDAWTGGLASGRQLWISDSVCVINQMTVSPLLSLHNAFSFPILRSIQSGRSVMAGTRALASEGLGWVPAGRLTNHLTLGKAEFFTQWRQCLSRWPRWCDTGEAYITVQPEIQKRPWDFYFSSTSVPQTD